MIRNEDRLMKNLLRAFILFMILFCLWPLSRVQGQNVADFVEAEVDRVSAYVGEPILYTWHVYLLSASTIDLNTQMRPLNFDGFGQEVLEPTTEPAIRDGQTYQVVTQQIVLYPRREGAYTLTPVSVLIPETPFAPARTLASASIEVAIRPLPAEAPATFSNAVGQFNLEGHLDQQAAQTGTPLVFTITITGSGNAPIISTPALTLGPEWRAYPRGSRLRRDGALLGERMFTWQIVALQPGALRFPSQSWSYLDPLTGQYETRSTEPFAVAVTGDPIAEPQIVAEPTLYPLQYGGLWHGDGTRDMLVLSPFSLSNMSSGGLFDIVLSVVLIGCPALAVFGVWAWGFSAHRRSAPERVTKKKLPSTFQSRLAALGQKPPHEIANGVETVLRDYLSQKRGITLTENTGEAELQSLPLVLRTRLNACFDEAQAARYAPFTSDDAAQLIQKARRLIQMMEDSWPAS
jgi:hypothetical protein